MPREHTRTRDRALTLAIRTVATSAWIAVTTTILAGCQFGGDHAEKVDLKAESMPGIVDGIERRTLKVNPFTVSDLVQLDPAISLSREQVARIVTDRVRQEIVNSPQFDSVDEGQPARYALRGTIDKLSVGPELTRVVKGATDPKTAAGGTGHETVKFRKTDCFLTVTMVDAATGKALCSAVGVSTMDVTLNKIQDATVTSSHGGGTASSSLTGNRFDQQQLSEVFYVAANHAATNISNQAIKLVFLPELKERAASQAAADAKAK